MSHRAAKKIRKLYRRDYRDKVLAQIDEMPAILAEQIKPKPDWMPAWLYTWAMRVVLK